MQEPKGGKDAHGAVLGASALAAFITFLVYLPSLKNGFVSYDDPVYITGNHIIRSLGLRFLKGALTETVSSNWHPLTMLSCAIDYALWGLRPWGYHLTNIILHALNTFLAGLLTARLVALYRREYSGAALAGFITALLFGLHPLHVESVSWISERKDVLSAFFFLLSALSYLRFSQGDGKWPYYHASLSFFLLALLSKPMAVTLPAALLILDYCPLEKLGPGKNNVKPVVEKVPFFALSAAISAITLLAQRSVMASLESYTLSFRLLIAARAYAFYLYRTVLPVNLAPYYDRPVQTGFFYVTVALSATALLLLTAVSFASAKRWAAAAWLYYLVTLLPVIGIVQVGGQTAADRYMYLPSLGPFVLIGAGAASLARRGKKTLYPAIAALAAVLAVFSVLTVKQEAVWKDTPSLWRHEIEVSPRKVKIAYNSLGAYYSKRGDYGRALDDLNTAISIDPRYMLAYNNRGLVYKELGYYRPAIDDFSVALRLDPDNSLALLNRGDTYAAAADYARAMDDYGAALRLDPKNPLIHDARGLVYMNGGDMRSALDDFDAAISLDPSDPLPYNNRGSIYARMKEYGLAIKDFRSAVSLKPDFGLAYKNLGTAHLEEGRYDAAIDDLGRAASISPGDPAVYLMRGAAFLDAGSYGKAIDDLNRAVRINPRLGAAYYYLGVSYYRAGRPGPATEFLRKASGLGVKEAQEFLNKNEMGRAGK